MQNDSFNYLSILLVLNPKLCFDPLIYNSLVHPFTSFDAIARTLLNLNSSSDVYLNNKSLHIKLLSKILSLQNNKEQNVLNLNSNSYMIETKPESFLGFVWGIIQRDSNKEFLPSDLELFRSEFQLILPSILKLNKRSHSAYSLFIANEQTFLKSNLLQKLYKEYKNNAENEPYPLKIDQSLCDSLCKPVINFAFKDVYELACLIYFNYNDIVKSIEKSRGISLKHSNQSELNFYLIFNLIAPLLYLIYGSTSEFKSELYNKFMVNTNSVPYSELILG